MLEKAIFPFSPGNVPNADWFGSDGGNMMKTLDAKIMATTPTPTSRKPHAMVDLVAACSSANNGDDISQHCHNRAHKEAR